MGVTRWLCREGARVTVSDRANAATLKDSIQALKGLDVALHFGAHDEEDFLEADLLVVNPAVPKEMPLLAAAESAGVPRTSEINLFLQRCRATVIGVTGTVGKSTTAAMIDAILACRFTTYLGGNIGRSLLEWLPEIAPDHLVVLELSSFQLEDLPLVGISPHVAIVTNFLPNHLDRHRTMDAYASAKKNIFAFQRPQDLLILNSACKATADWAAQSPGRTEWFDPGGEPFDLSVPGGHNQTNAQSAWAVVRQFGVDRPTCADALRRFPGLPHRLKFVLEREGVRYYNDSKCTTPEGAVTALDVFAPRSAIVLVGGYDGGVSFEALGEALGRRAKGVVALGDTKEKIAAVLEVHRTSDLPLLRRAESFPAAVRLAQELAACGDVVLLSPACASYDMFTNYEERGDTFVKLIGG